MWGGFIRVVTRTPPPFDSLLRAATARDRLGPLLRALGFDAPSAIDPAAWGAVGLGDIEGISGVLPAGERCGLAALVIEVDDDAPATILRIARRVRTHNPARLRFFIFAGPHYRRLVVASFGLGDELRQLAIDRAAPRRSDVDALEELAARDGEGGITLAMRHARALDRGRLTRQFFRDFRVQRARVADAWTGIPSELEAERGRLALLLLSRLMFLYFLQKRGHLAGDPAYLVGLLNRWRRRPGEGTFYRAVLEPLFFAALNTRPERRSVEARALGALPYLNGGLFERHALERRHPGLDLADDVVACAFDDLLERYRFTTREAAEAEADGAGDVGVDPEMLGRVFEGLMAAELRSASGSFYTPAPAVDRLVRTALETHLAGNAGLTPHAAVRLVRDGDSGDIPPDLRRAARRTLRELRILDPACGSGAFLLGALTRVERLRVALGEKERDAVRREIVGQALHGVDVQEDAALICALRLWLALAEAGGEGGRGEGGNDSVGCATSQVEAFGLGAAPPNRPVIAPLPNLDRRIRQGDALVDPIDLAMDAERGPVSPASIAMDAEVRRAIRALTPLAARYPAAEPEEKPALKRALAAAESRLAAAWLDALKRRLRRWERELDARAGARDLFGETPSFARRAANATRAVHERIAEVDRLRDALDEAGALPFFSFGIHFPEASARGFDLVLSNPPWVRAHRWPATVGRLVRSRYAVCRPAGWRRGAELVGAPGGVGGQVDLSLLFLERSLRLLAPGGTLGMLIPAKSFRSLYGAGARRLLLETTSIAAIEDHGLDQRSVFRADAFVASIVARKHGPLDRNDEADRRAAVCEAGREGPTSGDCRRARPNAAISRSPTPTGEGPSRGWSRVAAPTVRVTMIRRNVEPLRFCLAQDDLPILPDDPESPWLIAPPAARNALRRMQAAGTPLGAITGLRIRRGVLTGANDILIFRSITPKLGGLAAVRALGYDRARRDGLDGSHLRRFRAVIEENAIRPLVRGADLEPWRYRSTEHICWVHDDRDATPHAPPPRLARYLAGHAAALARRTGTPSDAPPGSLLRVAPTTLAPKVAWHDLALNLGAVALPARVPGTDGRHVPLVPLNTVYFIPTTSDAQALLLAAYLNSLPVRTFARAIAERAKDARFRFLAWTIALVPLPQDWDRSPAADRLRELSRRAHEIGALSRADEDELNRIIATCYGLNTNDMHALDAFDHWLRGDDR